MANNAITINIAPPTVSVGISRQGAPGREIELQAADGYIQWRYVGYPTWTNLIAVAALPPGPPGNPGIDASAYARRHAWVSPYSYCGTAPSGSAESAAVWRIARIQIADDGSTTVLHAVNVTWDDRLTASYS